MGVVERVRNLLSTDLDEMRARKDAGAEVRRYLRDLEWSFRELLEASRHAQASRDYLEGEIARSRECCRRWDDRAELALRHEDEGLARIALAKKQADLAQNTRIVQQLEACIREQRELGEQVNQLQERILSVRYLRRGSGADAVVSASPGEREVEQELEALKERLNRSKGSGAP